MADYPTLDGKGATIIAAQGSTSDKVGYPVNNGSGAAIISAPGYVAGGQGYPTYDGEGNVIIASDVTEPTLDQLRVGGGQARAADSVRAISGNLTHHVQRFVTTVGADCDALVFNLPNYYQSGTAEVDTVGDITWHELWAKLNGESDWVQVISSDLVVAAGDHETCTRAVFPSEFGLTQISQDDSVELKGRFSLLAGTSRIYCGGYYAPWTTDFQNAHYDPSVSTPSACNVDGDFTTASGAAIVNTNDLVPIIMLCRPLDYNQTFTMQVGSSIPQGFGDGGSNDQWGKGYAARASHDQNASSTASPAGGSPPFINQIGSLNFTRGGSNSQLEVTGTRSKWYMRFINTYIATDGTNDYQGYASVAALTTAQEAAIDAARNAEGSNVSRVIAVSPAAYCSSTDGYLTPENQTPHSTRWEEGGWTEQMRDVYLTWLEDGYVDGIAYPVGVVDPDAPWLFLTDGATANLVNYDSVHYNARGMEAHAETVREQVSGVWQDAPFIIRPYSVVTITGNAGVGEVLTAVEGVYGNMQAAKSPSYAYQWYRDDVAISGATSNTYTQGIADAGTTITVGVTPSNASGSLTEQISLTEVAVPTPWVTRGLIAMYADNYNASTGEWPDLTGITGSATQSTAAYRPAASTHLGRTIPDFENTGASDPNADWLNLPVSTVSLNNGAESTSMVSFIPRAASGKVIAGSNAYSYEINNADKTYSRVRAAFVNMAVTVTLNTLHVATLVNANGTNASKVGFDDTIQTFTRGSTVSTSAMYLGASGDTLTRLDGEIPCALLYNVALTDEEIAQNLTWLSNGAL